jgi:hypothetical protein
MKEYLVIVTGGLNTDIVGLGVDRLFWPGPFSFTKKESSLSAGKSS